MMHRELNPPAIVRMDVDSLIQQVQEALRDAEEHRTKGAAAYRVVGGLLAHAKDAGGFGDFGAFVRGLGISLRQAQRYMQLWNATLDDDDDGLNAAWSIICGHRDQQEPAESRPTPQSMFGAKDEEICCRPCRINGPKPNCKACKALRRGQEQAEEEAPTTAATDTPARPEAALTRDEPIDYAKTWKRARSVLTKRIKMMKSALEVPWTAFNPIRQAVRALDAFFRDHALARPKPPQEALCKRCGASILWATSTAHKRMPLDKPEAGAKGNYDLVDGLACQVEGWHDGLYRWHGRWCSATANDPIPE